TEVGTEGGDKCVDNVDKLRKKWWRKGTNPEEVCNTTGRQRGQGNFELNSHARLACYTMNKTGVASGSFS
ncbi:MAG: hypothetical protein WAT59_06410, partial [Blautia wexlerae]